MITDRTRLSANDSSSTASWGPASAGPGPPAGGPYTALVRRVAAAARAGVDLVQIRERDLDGGVLFGLVRRCLDAVNATSTRIIVNERVDVALAAGAHGAHLRGNSIPASRVRPLVPPGFLLGRSVHSREEAVQAAHDGALDYLMFGPVFETSSKPGVAGTGLDALGAVTAAVSLPVLAIGGVTPDKVATLARHGAAGFAAIGLFADGADETLDNVVETGRRSFRK